MLSARDAGKSNCAFNLVNDAFTGAYGTASAIGWAGNEHGVVTCLGGRFYVQGDINKAFGFGIYAGGADDMGRRRRLPAGADHQLQPPAARRSRSPSSPIGW